tara:strand:+ start:29 stop:556 length:528 start_codon:yes stop_codon:yes gene_type:complete
MKLSLIFLLSLNFLSIKCQNKDATELMNYIYDDILVEKNRYFVLDKSIDYTIADFELQNYQKRDLKNDDPNFPIELITDPPTDLNQTDWKKIQLPKTIFKTERELNDPSFLDKNKVFYAFSTPIFSKNKKYCIITVSENYTRGSIDINYVLKKENGQWDEVLNFVVRRTKRGINY